MKRFTMNKSVPQDRPIAQLAGRAIFEGTYLNVGSNVFKDNTYDNVDPDTGEIIDDSTDDSTDD